MTEELIYVGIDVAKDRVDVATRPADQHWSVSYDEAGVEALVAKLQVLEPAAVILEATGGLELPLVAAVAAAALPVAVVNPRQVRDFARSTGQLAKNDQLDARILAHFGEAVRPPIRPLRDADTQVFGPCWPVAARWSPSWWQKKPAESRFTRGASSHRGPHQLAGAGAERPGRRTSTNDTEQSSVAGKG